MKNEKLDLGVKNRHFVLMANIGWRIKKKYTCLIGYESDVGKKRHIKYPHAYIDFNIFQFLLSIIFVEFVNAVI